MQKYTEYLLKFSGVILVLFALFLWLTVWISAVN